MERQSALHRCHLEAHAQLETFYGWQLPAWYTEPQTELENVRASAGISDASYLTELSCRLCVLVVRARLTFSRISAALAVQMKGLGFSL